MSRATKFSFHTEVSLFLMEAYHTRGCPFKSTPIVSMVIEVDGAVLHCSEQEKPPQKGPDGHAVRLAPLPD